MTTMLAGSGTAVLEDVRLPLARPYLGLPIEALRGLVTDAAHLMTIENLTSFHEAAGDAAAAACLLLYTGGMPSPAWRRAYAQIVEDLPASTSIYHWGDIDEGGFRIASVLADVVRGGGRVLQPWRMCMSTTGIASECDLRVPTPGTLTAMCRWAGRAGWNDVAADLARHPLLLEQESLDVVLPTRSSRT